MAHKSKSYGGSMPMESGSGKNPKSVKVSQGKVNVSRHGPASGIKKAGMGANFDGKAVPQPQNNNRKSKQAGTGSTNNEGLVIKNTPKMHGSVTQPSKKEVMGADRTPKGY